MQRILIALILLFIAHSSSATESEAYGIELDALPWLTGGYYLSGWYAQNYLRYRAVASNINIPTAFVKEGFKDHEITAYALIVDYLPHQALSGIWYGAGLEFWQSRITNKSDNSKTEFDNTVFTIGLGYIWRLTDTVYLNPWAALHMLVDGNEDIKVGNKTYQQESIVPSASIKLGWQF